MIIYKACSELICTLLKCWFSHGCIQVCTQGGKGRSLRKTSIDWLHLSQHSIQANSCASVREKGLHPFDSLSGYLLLSKYANKSGMVDKVKETCDIKSEE